MTDQNFDITSPEYQKPEAKSLSWMPPTPRDESMRELSQRYTFKPNENIGFFGKVYNAFASETVIGELLREMSAPNYRDTGYVVSKEDIEKFAGDVDPLAASRAAASSDSLAEFLFETDQIRLTEKRRKELFSGGALGMGTGLALTLLAAGGEAVGLSLLAASAGAALGPGGSVAAGGAVAVNRVTRMRGLLKAMGTAAAIDVPLEAARYSLDKTMRPSDVIMALGASATLSGALGAWKPHLFLKELQSASDVATARTTANALRETGETAAAEKIEQSIKMAVRVVDPGEEVDRLAGLRGKALFNEAKEAGVETHRVNDKGRKVFRTQKEIREDLLDARVKKSASPEQVRTQVLRETEGLGRKALVDMAERVGGKTTGATENIIESIVEAKIRTGKTGKRTTMDAPRLPKGLGLKKTVPVKGTKVELKGTFEKVLWKLGTAKKKKTAELDEVRKILKERGFKDPDAMAKEFVKKVRAAKKTEGKKFVADAGKLKVTGASSKLEDGTVVTGFTREKDVETLVDSDIMGDKMITINGKPTVEGPEEFLEEVDFTPTPTPPRRTMTEHKDGLRETIARGIDYLGGDFMAYFFMPNTYRMLRSESAEVRRFAQEFMTGGRDGTHDVSLKAKIQFERFVGRVKKDINKARQTAWEEGYKISDLEIIRGVRSGEVFEGPLGDAIAAVRKHFKDVKAYGTKRGMPLDSIPDDLRYVTRRYNHSKFAQLIEAHGEGKVVQMFRDAILGHVDAKARGVTKAKANAAAKRIVNWGKSPDEVVSVENTKIRLDKIRAELIEDGIPEEEVDSFLELVSPKIHTEPHLAYAKRRIEMDENFVDPETGVHLDEFFNNNLDELLGRYAKQIVGGAETRIGLQKLFGDPELSREAVKSKILNSAKISDKERKYVGEVIDRVFREIGGQSIHPGVSQKTMRLIYASNAFGQATIGMTLGFAQITEIASVICRNGIIAGFQQMPSLGQLAKIFTMGIRDLRTGRQGLGLEGLDDIDDLGAVIETFTGIAGDYSRGDHFMRVIDDAGFDSDYIKSGSMKYLNYGQQVSFLNPLGVMPMDTMLRRWAGKAAFQNFVNMTFKKGDDGILRFSSTAWDNQKVRLKQMGLDEKDMARLKKAFEQPGAIEFKNGVFGGKVKSFNPAAFNDNYIFEKFAVALRKHVDGTVQRQSYGEMPEFWTSPVGKLLGQYRVFMIASKTKQLAAGVARGDAMEGANIVGACALGSLAYMLQTHYRAMGMEEGKRKEYLEKRLSQDYIFKAGMMKSPYSTVFPMIIDSASTMVGGDPVFDPSMRTTGLGIDPLRGSVPFSLLYNRLLPAGRELTGAMFRGDEISKQDLRNDQALLWFLKVPGIDQGVNQFVINPLNIPEKD